MAALPFIAVAAMAAGSIMQGMQSSQNSTAQANAATANAAYDRQLGNIAVDTAAQRGATQIRQGAEAVGSQAAAIAQSGTGIASGSSQDILRQTETNQRMDFLNTIYGGKIQKYGYNVDALEQDYAAKVAGMNKQNAIYGGFLGAGTSLLQSGASYGMMKGGFGSTTPSLSGGANLETPAL